MSAPLPGPAVRAFVERAQGIADQAQRDWSGPPTHRIDACELRMCYRPLAEQEALSSELERVADAALAELSAGDWDGRDAEERTRGLLVACRRVLGWIPVQYMTNNYPPADMQLMPETDRQLQAGLLNEVREAAAILRRAGCSVAARQPKPAAPSASGAATPTGGAAEPSGAGDAAANDDGRPQQYRGRRPEERLRKLLMVQAGEHPRQRFRRTIQCCEANGIMWPLPSDIDPDPIATLRGCCAAALHALDRPEAPSVIGGIPAYRAVVRTLPVLAEAAARRCGRPAPTFPPDTQDEEAARRCVEAVLDWCEDKPPLAEASAARRGDPVTAMLAAIARERRVQQVMSGPYLSNTFNWQAGVDRMWKRWDELFPDRVRPDKPICTTYAEASDAAVALLRELQSLQAANSGGHMAATPAAPSMPSAPLPAHQGGLFYFNLPAIFRGAVELGAAVHDQADGAASRAAEIAGERLMRVLNPHDAKFTGNFEWFEFQAHREVSEPWTRGEEPRPGWRQELDLADASAAARQALLTLGLALADLRGDAQWHDRGRNLLSAGTWNLWDGMGPGDRDSVRALLTETHRVWGWPSDPLREPEPFTGPTATMNDPRILSAAWRTLTRENLLDLQRGMAGSNFLVDAIGLPNGDAFPMYRLDCRPSNRALPSVCPKAAPKPPVQLRPEGDLLAESEAHYRSLGLIGDEQSIHWVGRQSSMEATCTCDLAAACDTPRSPEWQNLRQLRLTIRNLMTTVQRWAEQQIPPAYLEQVDQIGERAAGLIRALGWELPRFPQLPSDQAARLRGPASLPVILLDGGIILMAGARDIRVWESEWRAVLIAVEARLAAVDPGTLPCQAQTLLQVDSREVPMTAPDGTPSPLREAFDAVADALFHAAEMRRSPPNGLPMFEDQARALCDALGKARKSYAKAELQLRAVTDDGGRCAHQEALNAACQVNDACGHVMLKIVPSHQAAAHILAVPAFDLAELLRAMRRQTSRAALQHGSTAQRAPIETQTNHPTYADAPPASAPPTPAVVVPATKRKRSTERGEARTKLIAALTKHHQYADGGCLNLEPIGVNQLARAACAAPASASAFFSEKFQGHDKYRALCRDSGRLAAALKLLNGEYAPHDLYGCRPPKEDGRDDE